MAHGQGMRKNRPRRKLARRILVVTEGAKTEQQYLDGLNQYLRSQGATAVVKSAGMGRDPLKVVQKCIELRDDAESKDKRYDYYVCLVDVDEHATLERAIELAHQKRITLLISNLKFEVWLRWHAEDKRSALTSTQLDQCVKSLGLTDGKKLSNNFPYSKVYEACAVARAVDPEMQAGRQGPNPSSAMPILVELLEGKKART